VTNYWKFTDVKSYHITHHKLWLGDKDPTAKEVRQGFWKYYIGVTDPTPIQSINAKNDPLVDWFNQHFYTVKIGCLTVLLLLLGWKVFVHLVIIQQFLVYFSLKIQDLVYHSKDSAKDHSWLYLIYGPDAWHIEHHSNYEKMITWRYKYVDAQYLLTKLFFK
jgi:fatty-acid desaturase